MRACLLCGAETHDVRTGLVAWREPVGREAFSAIPRCIDQAACRRRVESIGDEWPLLEPGEKPLVPA